MSLVRSMKAENRAILGVVVAVLVVTSAAGAYLLLRPSAIPTGLAIPAGTVFTSNESEGWVAHFSVGPGRGRLVGSWTAYDGYGYVGLLVVNGTVSKPTPPLLPCPLLYPWTEFKGTIDRELGPGPYTVYWSTGFCSNASRILVTLTIQVVSL